MQFDYLDFEAPDGIFVTARNDGDDICIVDSKGKVWMRITFEKEHVYLTVLTHNIPSAYIGEKAKAIEERKCDIYCETEENAQRCKQFLSDFIVIGYGDSSLNAERQWLIALDLADLMSVISSGTMLYHALELDIYDTEKTVRELCREHRSNDLKELLVCVYTRSNDPDALAAYDSAISSFQAALPDDVAFMQQCIPDKSLKSNAIVHVLYNRY